MAEGLATMIIICSETQDWFRLQECSKSGSPRLLYYQFDRSGILKTWFNTRGRGMITPAGTECIARIGKAR